MLSYDQCLAYLAELPVPKEMTTQHIRRLMAYMDNPQDQLKVIHITGTNGKGSTGKMIESILLAAEYSTGLFSSPSLVSINEGIQINGEWIDNLAFADSANKVFSFCEKMVKDGYTHPSNFECQVAIAIDFFNKISVDLVIMEVGLGGKTDGTNIFSQPLLTIITSIGLDHTEYLGSTLAAIATEKSGIMRPDVPILIGLMQDTAYMPVRDRAREIGAPIFDTNEMRITTMFQQKTLSYEEINLLSENTAKVYPCRQQVTLTIQQVADSNQNLLTDEISGTIDLSLLGPHQSSNAILALLSVNYLNHIGYAIGWQSIRAGFSTVQWPCRCEYFVLNYNKVLKPIVIDGAHNLDSINALVEMITTTLPDLKKAKTVILFSALKDKEIQLMLNALAAISEHIICTQISHPRGEKAENIGQLAQKMFKKVEVIETSTLALNYILNQTDCELTIITGSLYMTMPLYQQHFKALNYEPFALLDEKAPIDPS